MDPELQTKITLLVVLIISLTVHEAAHALLAMLGGDRTAYHNGQVSLNPIPHIRQQPFGMLVLPVFMLFFSGTGYCLGFANTPIDPYWAARHPRRAAWMSLAGPASNFLLAGLAVLGMILLVEFGLATGQYDYGDPLNWIRPVGDDAYVRSAGKILTVMAWLNGLLGVLNLFPWPPLDGAGVVRGFLPRQTASFYDRVQHSTPLMIGGILLVYVAMGRLSMPIYFALRDLVQG